MRKFHSFFLAMLGMYSCSFDLSSDKWGSDVGYIKLEKDNFILTVDRVNAYTKNISEQEYDVIFEDTKKANEVLQMIISDLKSDSSIKRIYVADIRSDSFYDVYEDKYTSTLLYEINSNVPDTPSIKSRFEYSYEIPKGFIETYGSENVSQGGIFAPNGLKGVNCSCQAKVALLATHFVTTSALGTAIVRTRVGNGALSVPLDASNMNFTISYATTDSNGGRCSWSGYM